MVGGSLHGIDEVGKVHHLRFGGDRQQHRAQIDRHKVVQATVGQADPVNRREGRITDRSVQRLKILPAIHRALVGRTAGQREIEGGRFQERLQHQQFGQVGDAVGRRQDLFHVINGLYGEGVEIKGILHTRAIVFEKTRQERDKIRL